MKLLRTTLPTVVNPLSAIDEQTAIQVVDQQVEVVSQGEWLLLEPAATR